GCTRPRQGVRCEVRVMVQIRQTCDGLLVSRTRRLVRKALVPLLRAIARPSSYPSSLSSGHIPLGKTFECLWPFGPASIRMSSELRPNRLNGPPQLLTCEGVARIELERAFQGILELLLLQGELKLVAAEHPARLEVTAPLIGCATLEWRLLDQLVERREEPTLRR